MVSWREPRRLLEHRCNAPVEEVHLKKTDNMLVTYWGCGGSDGSVVGFRLQRSWAGFDAGFLINLPRDKMNYDI
jgi:hypothetical protein